LTTTQDRSPPPDLYEAATSRKTGGVLISEKDTLEDDVQAKNR